MFDDGLLGPAEMVVTENFAKNLLVGQGGFAMRLGRTSNAKRWRGVQKRTDALIRYCPAFYAWGLSSTRPCTQAGLYAQ
jgi:hypothetical protein